MKTITVILILCSSIIAAQTHRFVYEFQFKEDSTASEYQKNNMILDVNPNTVKFYDYEYAENDSINRVRNYHNYLWNDTPLVTRKKDSNINNNYVLLNDYFYYVTTDNINWQLSKETMQEGKYTLQKATTTFGGRNWTAWFCKDLIINEGPYKFRGLPGLIFKLEDRNKNFIFNLVKSYKLDKTYDTSDFIESFEKQKPILITEEVLNKKKLDFYNDPFYDLKQNFVYNPNETIKIMNVTLTDKKQLKELTELYQEDIRKHNNPIELDKAIHYP